MTVIVGLEHRGKVWLGCDSFMGTADDRDEDTRSKVCRRRGWLLGFAGSWALLPSLRRLDVGPPTGTDDDGARLASAMKRAAPSDFDREGTWVLAAGGGRLWTIQAADWASLRSSRGYAAVGVGADVALGSLHSTRATRVQPERRVRLALLAAESHCPCVGGRFRIFSN